MSPSKMALGAALALAAAGCGNSDVLGVYEGRVRFVLSSDDATVTSALRTGDAVSVSGPSLHGGEDRDRDQHFFASANVTFSSIVARNLAGMLVEVVIEGMPVTVDVVAMDDGRRVVLPDGQLPPATYDQLVVVMTQVEGVTFDGTTITITPPGGGWTSIVPVCPFVVGTDDTTVVELQFNLHRAFRWRDNRFHFEPRFVCEQDEEPDTDSP